MFKKILPAGVISMRVSMALVFFLIEDRIDKVTNVADIANQ